jgi:uncharacterized peroxidase-related enzyme
LGAAHDHSYAETPTDFQGAIKMTWIKIVSFEEARGRLRQLYERIAHASGNVDNIMLAHSLRPHSMEGHMQLYKNVLHHTGNSIDKWFLEALGVYVSLLNRCDYCVEHHFQGMRRLIDDDGKATAIRAGLQADQPAAAFDAAQTAAMAYARKLTLTASAVTEDDIVILREHGFDDGQVLEINQVVAYFNYANRTVLGLGVHTDGDIIGLSPNQSDDPDNWQHS